MFIPNMNKLQYTGCGSGANQLLCHTKLPDGLGYMKGSSNCLCNNQTLEHCMNPSSSRIIAFVLCENFLGTPRILENVLEELNKTFLMDFKNLSQIKYHTDIIWPLPYVTQWTF